MKFSICASLLLLSLLINVIIALEINVGVNFVPDKKKSYGYGQPKYGNYYRRPSYHKEYDSYEGGYENSYDDYGPRNYYKRAYSPYQAYQPKPYRHQPYESMGAYSTPYRRRYRYRY